MDAATPKEEFLQTIRQALGKASPTTVPQPDKSSEERERQVAKIEKHLAKGRSELLDSLAEIASKVSWQVHRAASHEEASQLLATIAKEKGVRSALHSSHPVLDRISLTKALPGVSLTLMEAQDDPGWAALRQEAPQADLGVTGTDYAIAETGSCVILSRPGVSRMTSLLPPVHVAIVEPQQVLASLDELFILLGDAYAQDRLSPYLNLISGPSRTGDIEQTLVIGAHGPKEAHLIIIG